VSENTIEAIQAQIGVHFHDPSRLQLALTHRSYVNEHGTDEGDNERLEFLGDAVLSFLVGEMLFQRFPEMSEGQLTRLRAGLVRTESLAGLARALDLGAYLRMGRGERSTGGAERINNLCAAFEALVGALYLDQGLEVVQSFVLPRLETLMPEALAEAFDKDARSRLQEWSQSALNQTPVYHTVSATGPDHNKEFVVQVTIGDRVVGRGAGRSKQSAAQAAADDALRAVERGELQS
jgi:ribonuclease-3